MKKLVIFDFDGVLVQTEFAKINYYEQALSSYGMTCRREDLVHMIGIPHEDFISRLDLLYMGNESYQLHRQALSTHKEVFDYNDLLTPHVKELLHELKSRNMQIAVASNSSFLRLKQALLTCGLDAYIDFICSGTDEGRKKPDPYIYLKTMEKLHVEAKETIIVEDSSVGIEAALQSGALVIGFDYYGLKIDQTRSHMQISDLLEVVKLLT